MSEKDFDLNEEVFHDALDEVEEEDEFLDDDLDDDF